MKRALYNNIIEDLNEKMVFLSGPRQVGKTTLACEVLQAQRGENWADYYLNWDDSRDRKTLLSGELPSAPGLIVLDEVHKYKAWRQLLKGFFDKKKQNSRFLVTGSAMLDFYRRGGDSLQGRYHFLRMHPLSLKELAGQSSSSLDDLMTLGGFPEPFFSGSAAKAKRWSHQYASRLVREEIVGLETVKDISSLEILSDRLPDLVGSPLSYNALREDLGVAHATVVRWIDILERLYSIFRILPFGSPKIRAVKKEVKHYHFDWTRVSNSAFRFENLVACHLYKECNFIEDTQGRSVSLRYFRDTDKREVDFVVMEGQKPRMFVECKMSDEKVSPHLQYLKQRFPEVEAVQVVYNGKKDVRNESGTRIVPAKTFLLEPLKV
jgi:uncharacterized protein